MQSNPAIVLFKTSVLPSTAFEIAISVVVQLITFLQVLGQFEPCCLSLQASLVCAVYCRIQWQLMPMNRVLAVLVCVCVDPLCIMLFNMSFTRVCILPSLDRVPNAINIRCVSFLLGHFFYSEV